MVRRLPQASLEWERQGDVVVIGAGAAGLSTALAAAASGRSVLLLCKGSLSSGATTMAQGGLAAVLYADDSLDLHVRDTVMAGAGLCDAEAVRRLVGAAPAEVARLRALGAAFDVDPERGSGLAVTREGGHSRDRVVHAGGDATGAEIDRTLVAAVRSEQRVQVLEHVIALDALLDLSGAAVGVTAARVGAGGRLACGVVLARAVVLATGGIGQAWSTTTNPAGATGDGLGLALRAGAQLRDMEFVQFHPTVLWRPDMLGRQPLVSEALRGEGAVLVDATGRRVMLGAHPLADLAPRDIVAATMHERMAEAPGGVSTHLHLDATMLGRDLLEHRFPTVLATCRAAGIDPVREPIPVAPGAHYSCGGVTADLQGRTSVTGLFAVGEVASTGVHGANRLASNSVTEALFAGREAGELLGARLPSGGEPAATAGGGAVLPSSRSATALATSREAGLVRSGDGLGRLTAYLEGVPDAGTDELTLQVVEATALHTVSTLVAVAALTRRESRGCHRRQDAPGRQPQWLQHVTMHLDVDRIHIDTHPQESAA
ncbi:MAG: L-aspartate oxidase [Actinomycetota bacterium]|nr:L-aspartate oxidase [Actinomycetota bacterium]